MVHLAMGHLMIQNGQLLILVQRFKQLSEGYSLVRS